MNAIMLTNTSLRSDVSSVSIFCKNVALGHDQIELGTLQSDTKQCAGCLRLSTDAELMSLICR